MTRCSACPGTANCVAPNGPTNSPYILLGEAPGKEENAKKVPFIGKTGEELNRHYLPLAGLRRENVYVMNTISCLPDRTDSKLKMDREKDRDLATTCFYHHVAPKLGEGGHRLIVAMGAFANFVLDPEINLEYQHGIPLETAWGTVFPLYHPAGGIHSPKEMMKIRTDWTRLKKYLAGKLHIPTDPYEGMEDYRHLDSKRSVDSMLDGRWHLPLANDTENKRDRSPFCCTFSTEPGTGYLIRAGDPETLAAMQYHLDRWEGPILWHNWPWDALITAAMGLRFNRKKIVDTMAFAFQLGNIPQGLKPLCYRLLGMNMKDFDDVVSPHSRELVLDYYRQANLQDWAKPEQELVRDKDGSWKLYSPRGFGTKLKIFFTYFAKNQDKDVFEAWDNWEMHHEEVEDMLGPYPGKCISHVPFDEVIHYACQDADGLGRLYPLLKRAERMVRKKPQEHWLD